MAIKNFLIFLAEADKRDAQENLQLDLNREDSYFITPKWTVQCLRTIDFFDDSSYDEVKPNADFIHADNEGP